MKTGVIATRLALTAFVIPYMFVYSPAMLFYNTNVLEVASIIISALIGMFGVAFGLTGFLLTKLNILQRLMGIAGGLLLIKPGIKTDITGLLLIAAVVAMQLLARKKTGAVAL
jgi:TRAP-type uncharacterized transport system fused permease subunit